MTSHPRTYTLNNFVPSSRSSTANWLRAMADMIENEGPPYNAAIEEIAVEMLSEEDSPTADVTIRMRMKNNVE